MKIFKRNGSEESFNEAKIVVALDKANKSVPEKERVSDEFIKDTARYVTSRCSEMNHTPTVEEIQDIVERCLMQFGAYELAKNYITYRYSRALIRQSNTTDEKILSLIDCNNEEIKQENSNKNPIINSTQRDYMAGEVSKDITARLLLPKDIVEAHNEGIIHVHDSDYFAQKMHNCSLINLEDMLQNGTVISGTMIERPHSFSTACNIATQIIAKVASNQYGGQSISLTHLAPFVQVSREKIRKTVVEEFSAIGITPTEEQVAEITERRLREEIRKGVQMIQYQVVTLLTSNGQTPFVTVFMYLGEAKDEQERSDLALIIEETLLQRYQGVKNESGVWVTPAFPKLIYVLEEDNIHEDSKYWYLTKLAAKCTAKRMVPDYISEKKMLELKIDSRGNGNCYPAMGCVDGDEVVTYKYKNHIYTEGIKRMWERMSDYFPVKHQYCSDNPNLYIDLNGVEIYDQKVGFVKTFRIIRNNSTDWVNVRLSGGRTLCCTADHLFTTENRGDVKASELTSEDKISIDYCYPDIYSTEDFNTDKAWFLGFMICDGCYQAIPYASIAEFGEYEIEKKFVSVAEKYFDTTINTKHWNRGSKGNYIDLIFTGDGASAKRQYFISKFNGIPKKERRIPPEVFEWNIESKLSFLAGMIDADGYINPESHRVQIGSTNKELALQQAYLAQSLGMSAMIYCNHYKKNNPNAIRYRVEFLPIKSLIDRIVCEKKKNNYIPICKHNRECIADVLDVIPIKKQAFSYDVSTESEHFTVSGIYSHNCRSFLTPYVDENGKPKYYGRFNQGVVTLNLPDVALSAHGNIEKFWKILDERLELCHRALMCRHERLTGTKSDVAPILWQYGALARLEKGEKIDKLLHGGYSTISLGYAGLWECVYAMTGHKLTDKEGEKFGLEVMQTLNKYCNKWREDEDIHYSLYGTPIESTTYKFARCLQKRFGIVEGVTDKGYITNSYHVHVTEPIDAFTKLEFEAQFQHLSPGGAISYVEVPDMQNNLDAVLEVMKFIYDHIIYAELNTKSDYCQGCGWDGEISIVEEDGKLIWKCPQCGNTDQNKMNVARRTCGYIGTQFWNQGRTQEIKERVLHL